MKKQNRRWLALALALLMAFSVTACAKNAETTTETPSAVQETEVPATKEEAGGEYSASANGFGGEVVVTILVENGTIVGCTIQGDKETPELGGRAVAELPEKIVAAGGLVDGISGATVTSTAIQTALNNAMIQAGLKEETAITMRAGTYTGTAVGFNAKANITVTVQVDETSILDIQLQDDFVDYTVTDTPGLVKSAFAAMAPRMIENQSLSVDAVSGATGSGNGIRQAVANALEQAIVSGGGDASQVSAFYKTIEKSTETVKLEGYDVIIVGAGAAGVGAALQTVTNPDMKVITVEKAAHWGGTSMLTSGPVVYSKDITEEELDAAIQRFLYGNGAGMCPNGIFGLRHGDDVIWNDADYAAEHADEYQEANLEALREVFRVSGDVAELFMENGYKYCLGYTPEEVTSVDVFTHEDGGTMISYNNNEGSNKNITPTYYAKAKESYEVAGGETLMETTVQSLLYDGDKIVGVEGIGYDGTVYQIYGTSVILATGGYGANEELVLEYTGDSWGLIGAPNQGEGTVMALEAGGKPYHLDAYPMIHQRGPAVFMRSFEAEEYEGTLWSPNDIPHVMALSVDGVYVNAEGETIDRASFGRWGGGEASAYVGSTYYTIYSAELIEEYKNNGMTDTTLGRYFGQYGVIAGMPLANIETVLEAGIEQGYIYRVSSLTEADQLLGLPEGSTEAAYQASENELQNAESEYYYIVEGKGYGYSSCGGIEVTKDMQVVKTDGSVIENLFLTGTDSLGNIMITGAEYPTGGDAHTWAMAGGYIAANKAMELAGK